MSFASSRDQEAKQISCATDTRREVLYTLTILFVISTPLSTRRCIAYIFDQLQQYWREIARHWLVLWYRTNNSVIVYERKP
jgi:hypothetical protein